MAFTGEAGLVALVLKLPATIPVAVVSAKERLSAPVTLMMDAAFPAVAGSLRPGEGSRTGARAAAGPGCARNPTTSVFGREA